MTLRCVPVDLLRNWLSDSVSVKDVPPPPADIAEALKLAKEFIDEPYARARVKIQLPLIADMIDEAVAVSRALLKSWGRE